jgi:hypothetical protein
MSTRFLSASAMLILLAGPAFANCEEELASLDQAVVEAKTGTGETEAGMPASQHQEQVLGEAKESGDTEAAGAGATTGQPSEAGSPHQTQVLAGSDAAASGEGVAELIAEAHDMAQSGDEEGCMEKVTEAKEALGIN